MKEINGKFEIKLKEKITKYLQPMKWRRDFEEWKRYRIWQEKYQESRVKSLKKYIGSLENIKILDLGCGMGGFSVALKQSGINVISIDFNYDYLEITKLRGRRYGLEVKVINGMGEQLPFKDSVFDIVTCWDVLEHVQDPERVLKDINRVLKSQGRLFITIINKYAIKDPHYKLAFINWLPKSVAERYIRKRGHSKNKMGEDKQKLSEMHYFTFKGFVGLANDCGFTVRDVREQKMFNGDYSTLPKIKQNLLNILKVLRLNILGYRLMRYFWFGSYNLLLTKNEIAY